MIAHLARASADAYDVFVATWTGGLVGFAAGAAFGICSERARQARRRLVRREPPSR